MISVPPHRRYLLWIGLLGLVVIYVGALLAETLRIERSIEQQVDVAMVSAGLGRVHAEVRGRDVSIKGLVSSEAARREAVRLAQTVEGVRVVDTQIMIFVRQMAWLRLNAGVLSGQLPRSTFRDAAEEALTAAGVSFESEVVVDADIGNPDWIPLLDSLGEAIAELERPGLEIGAGKAMISGRLAVGASADARVEKLRESAATFRLELINRVAEVSR